MTDLNTSTEITQTTEPAIGFIPCYRLPFLSLFHADCMEIMTQYPDKYFDLAIVDPPYGIGDKFKGGKTGKMNFNEIVNKDWDKVPPTEYFNELMRVSKNQIIWGGNYFNLPPTRCFIVWDKIISDDFSLAMAELAWTSFDKLAKSRMQKIIYEFGEEEDENYNTHYDRMYLAKEITHEEYSMAKYDKPDAFCAQKWDGKSFGCACKELNCEPDETWLM